jgi:hypothetical protein
VKYLATAESDMVSRLKLLGVSAAEESRTFTNRGYTVEDMKNVGETPGWLLQFDKVHGADGEKKGEDDGGSDGPNAKDGRFGPRAPGLSMPLPSAFPEMAGFAKEALKANLKKDEKAKKKIEQNRIPEPDEAVRLKEEKENKKFIETPKWLVKRRKQKELARMIELDVGMNIMLSSGYPAGRRESLAVLPGMSKHYPNSMYVNRAVLPPGYEEPTEQRGLFQGLFGKKKKKKQSKNSSDIVVAPPVGRKPLSSCSQHGHFTCETKDDDSAIGHVDADSVFPFLAEDGAASVATAEEAHLAVPDDVDGDTANKGRRGSGSVETGAGRRASASVISGDAIPEGRRGSNSDGRRGSVNPDATSVGVSGSDDVAVVNTGSVVEAVEEKAETNSDDMIIASFAGSRSSRVPKDVYLDRRGSFHVAPGLENFSKYLDEKKDAVKNIKYDQFGRVISGSEGKTTRAPMTERREIKAAGLIRVMHTNVSTYALTP